MPESRRNISGWVFDRLPLFLLPLLCLLLYLPALRHDFVMDDTPLVVANPYITSWKYFPQMLGQDVWNVWDRHNYWRPLFSISLALDYSLWQLNPLGFHLTNMLLHAINGILLYLLGKKLQSAKSGMLASLLFAFHPIQAHAVSVISVRADLLAALFTLLAITAFLSRRRILFACTLMLALLSKETSIVLPFLLLFAGFLIERERPDSRHFLAFAVLGLYVLLRLSLGFSFSLPESIFSYHAASSVRPLLAFKVLALYFLALFNLFEIPHPFWSVEIPASLGDPYVMGGIGIFVLLLGAIWRGWKKNALVAFGLIWFFIFFLPISNLKELNQPMAEHWLYIPMIGLGLSCGAALGAAWIRLREVPLCRLCVPACVAVFLVFGSLVTREKTKIYHDDESFLLAAIRANPQVAKLYGILGSTYLARQDVSRAKEFYAKALHLDPSDFLANYRTGFLFYRAGQRDEAKRYLSKVVQYQPARLSEILSVADAWEMLGEKQKALLLYRKAFGLNPRSAYIREKVAALENSLRHGSSSPSSALEKR